MDRRIIIAACGGLVVALGGVAGCLSAQPAPPKPEKFRMVSPPDCESISYDWFRLDEIPAAMEINEFNYGQVIRLAKCWPPLLPELKKAMADGSVNYGEFRTILWERDKLRLRRHRQEADAEKSRKKMELRAILSWHTICLGDAKTDDCGKQ